MKRGGLFLLLLVAILICCCAIVMHGCFSKPSSPQELISSLWGDEDIHITVITELTDNWDLVLYSSATKNLAEMVLEKDNRGCYTGEVVGAEHGNLLENKNRVFAALLSKEPECTLYFGLAKSADWHIDYNGSVHRIVVNELILEYFLYPKTMDNELLHLEFVQ